MLNALIKIGQFLRLLDEKGQISLTNISVYISLYRLLTVPNASFSEVGTFLLAAVAYNFKKTISGSTSTTTSSSTPTQN